MKRAFIYLVFTMMLACASLDVKADITNGNFESGLTGWTGEYHYAGDRYEGYFLRTETGFHQNDHCLFGSVITYYPRSWATLTCWSDYQNMDSTASIKLSMVNPGFMEDTYGGLEHGYVQEIALVLNDGATTAECCLADLSEGAVSSLLDEGQYSTDGYLYNFNVPLDSTYFSLGFSNLNLSNARLGILWKARNDSDSFQKAIAQCDIDDISLVPVPEPSSLATMLCGLAGVGGAVVRRIRI